MRKLTYALIAFIVIGVFTGCTRRSDVTHKKGDSLNITSTEKPVTDSTDIYGKGYFDYRDTLESFHMGYSIPRDSVYKVENLKAFQELNLLIRRDSLNPGPYLDRANHLQNIHKYIEAIKDYDMYIALNPYNHSAYQNRGTAHERLKQFDQALWDYQKVLELKPDDTIANFNKGVVYDVIGNPWQAIKEYDTVVMKDPKLAKAYYNRGASYEKVAKYDEAIINYKKAMELNPMYRNELEVKVDYLNYEYR
ncbi:MAG: tetratricopeptide repeat protein [Ignavibacteria bacterium]|jgi:tetratricopeptide (TPR) repeat protein|nr:tetratricopeptide repeat protein [Ignavibacteria bacterium]